MSNPSLDWADAVRVIQHWADPAPALITVSPDGYAWPTASPSSVNSDWLAASEAWLQSCQRGWDLAIQAAGKYAPPVAAFSLASFSGGYWLQDAAAVTFDLRSPTFAPMTDVALSNRFTIPSPPIPHRLRQRQPDANTMPIATPQYAQPLATMAMVAAPEGMQPEFNRYW